MEKKNKICSCEEVEELFECRTDSWGRRWWLDVEDIGYQYAATDRNGMTYVVPYCPVHGARIAH